MRLTRHAAGETVSTLFVVLLSVYALEYSTYFVTTFALDRVVKLSALGGLLLIALPIRLRAGFGTTILLYGILLASTIPGSILRADLAGVIQSSKVGLMMLFLVLVISRGRRDPQAADRLVLAPVFWGTLFAVQGVILVLLVMGLSYVPANAEIPIERMLGAGGSIPNMRSLGLFGYVNTLSPTSTGYALRIQSWFSEPAQLAAYLQFPALVSLGYYYATRRLRFLVSCLLCAAGIVLTFSLAAYLGLAFAFGTLLAFRQFRKAGRNSPIRVATAVLVAAVLFYSVQAQVLQATYRLFEGGLDSQLGYLLARNPDTQTLVRGASNLDFTLATVASHPLGLGLGGTLGFNENTSTNALLWWLQAGGIPAAIVLAALYATLFIRFSLPCLLSESPKARFVAAAFMAVTLHELSYGNWTEPHYLFSVGIMMIFGDRAREDAVTEAKRKRNAELA